MRHHSTLFTTAALIILTIAGLVIASAPAIQAAPAPPAAQPAVAAAPNRVEPNYPYPYPYPEPTVTPYPYPYPYPEPTVTPGPYPYPYPYPYPEPTVTPGPYPYPYPEPTSTPPSRHDPADVTVSQRASPGRSVRAGGLVNYTIELENQGDSRASGVNISFSYSKDLAGVVDVATGRSGDWVSRNEPGLVVIRAGGVGPGDESRIRVRLAVNSNAPAGAILSSSVRVSWSQSSGGGSRDGNRVRLQITPADDDDTLATLTVNPDRAAPGVRISFSNDGSFIPGEAVALWYDGPDGRSHGLGRISANPAGGISYTLDTARLRPGRHMLVAYGIWSGVTAVGRFEITGPAYP